MATLGIAWEYLAGQAVATDPTDYSHAEWPPNPDRVFQALVCAWGEGGADPDERAALEWLERLPAPDVVAPGLDGDGATRATTLKVFVPVNDPGRKAFSKDNGLERLRKARTFNRISVGVPCALLWYDVAEHDLDLHGRALAALAERVTRIGHSSSMVRAWLVRASGTAGTHNGAVPGFLRDAHRWRPVRGAESASDYLRVPYAGRLTELEAAFQAGARPSVASWMGYVEAGATRPRAASPTSAGSVIVLPRASRAQWAHLGETLDVCRALRGTLLNHARGRALELLSGHEPGGGPLQEPHVHFIPLPHVGSAHADGHLLGMAMVLPRDTSPVDDEAIRRALAQAARAGGGRLHLHWGRGRTFELTTAIPDTPPVALRPGTWARRARVWASVTPVVLDRHPSRTEARRLQQVDAWLGFARSVVDYSCQRVGLPRPSHVTISDVSLLEGVPHVRSFPKLQRSRAAGRFHVHVLIEFDEPVRGPVLIGAGRYRGYGLLRPVAPGWPAGRTVRSRAHSHGTEERE